MYRDATIKHIEDSMLDHDYFHHARKESYLHGTTEIEYFSDDHTLILTFIIDKDSCSIHITQRVAMPGITGNERIKVFKVYRQSSLLMLPIRDVVESARRMLILDISNRMKESLER